MKKLSLIIWLGAMLVCPLMALAAGGPTLPPAEHVIMLDVSGSMSSNNPQYGQYGTYDQGFTDNIIKLFSGLLAPDGKLLRAEDRVVLFPFTSPGADQGRSRSIIDSGLTLDNFSKTLSNPQAFPGPGDGGWGQGLVPHLQEAMELPGAVDGQQGMRFYWLLTDNGLGNAAGQDPFPFYSMLRDNQQFSHVWFMPLNELPGSKGSLVLYLILEKADLDADWPDELFALLQSRLNGEIWPDFKRSIMTFRPLVKMVTFKNGDEKRLLPMRITQLKTRGGQDEDWSDLAYSHGTPLEVLLAASPEGGCEGALRYEACLPAGWKIDHLKAKAPFVSGVVPAEAVVEAVPQSEPTKRPARFAVTWTFSLDEAQLEELRSQGIRSVDFTLHYEGQTKVTIGEKNQPGLGIDISLLQNVRDLDKLLQYLVFSDSTKLEDKRQLAWQCQPLSVCLLLPEARTSHIWLYVGGVFLILVGGLAVLLFSGRRHYRFLGEIKKADNYFGSESLSQDFVVGVASPAIKIDAEGSFFVKLVPQGRESFLAFVTGSEEAREVGLDDEQTDKTEDGHTIVWHIESAFRSAPAANNSEAEEVYI